MADNELVKPKIKTKKVVMVYMTHENFEKLDRLSKSTPWKLSRSAVVTDLLNVFADQLQLKYEVTTSSFFSRY